MFDKAEAEKRDQEYATICFEHIKTLYSINKAMTSNGMTDKQVRIIQDNVSLMMQLKREHDNNF
jgi:hypothetical protein